MMGDVKILDHRGRPIERRIPGMDPMVRRNGIVDIDTMEDSIYSAAADDMPRISFARERKDYISDKVALAYAGQSSAGTSDVSTLEEQQLKYEQSLFVYACVFAIASNLSAVPLVAYQKTPGGVEDQPDSELQFLLDHPHEVMTQEEMNEQSLMYLCLTGSSFTYADRGNGEDALDIRGDIVELKPMRTSRIDIIPGEGRGGVQRFLHTVSGQVTPIAPENVCWVRRPNPNNDYWGLSPLQLISRTMAIDENVEIYNHTALDTGGVPDVILEAPHTMGRGKSGRVRREWESHYRNGRSGGAVVLDEGLTAKAFGVAPKDMQFHEMSSITMHRILAAFGVPPIMVMDLRDASVLANAKEQRELFWENTIQPLGRRYANALTRLFHTDPRFSREQGWGVRFAFERASFQKRDDNEVAQSARENYAAGVITLNEARQDIGKDPIEEGGDEFKPSGSPIGGFDFSSLAYGGANPRSERPRPRFKGIVQVTEEYKSLARVSHRRLVRVYLQEFQKGFDSFFQEQARRVIVRLKDHTNQKSHRNDDFADEDFLAALFPTGQENEEMRSKIGSLFLGASVDAGNQRIEQILPDSTITALTEEHARFKSLLNDWAATKVVNINNETRLGIRDILVESFQVGATDDAIEESIKGLFERFRVGPEGKQGTVETRVEAIARTESQTALNSGSFQAAREIEASGVKLYKSWLSSRDSRVRSSHSSLDSFTSASPIPLGKAFSNGLMHPHDPAGPASEVVNCRCSLIEIVPERPPR